MNENKEIKRICTAEPSGVDDAVGVSEAKWFVAIVNNRAEKTIAQKLSKLGIENFLPLQEELRVWKNGKKTKIERSVIPARIFIRCTEERRREIVNFPFIFRFMTNQAGTSVNSGNKPLAVVPDFEIEQLKFMLGVSNVNIQFAESFVKGDIVEVLRGPFKGLQGVILHDAGGPSCRLFINIDFLGSASVEIDSRDVAPLSSKL
ncbi:MAG: UpxY family transcription antiterminator [Muribaculaceae bacterium]|nr:UpxY family transcription antiterminator [Muribaculaceae bacterium]